MSHGALGLLKRITVRIGRSGSPSLEDIDFVVLGLGNPGPEYVDTRHNAGSNAVRRFVGKNKGRLKRIGRLARVARIDIETSAAEEGNSTIAVLAAVPTTFMNDSGSAARWLMQRCSSSPERLMVVHDDLDLPLGILRAKFGGGSGGHRGVESVIKALGTNAFQRLRIGIGRPPEDEDAVDYVLGPFAPEERTAAEQSIERAAEAIQIAATRGIDAAMNLYNGAGTSESGTTG